MTIEVGQKLPEATFKVLTSEGLADVRLADITSGRKVVIFALPGAFTPTCHAKHVPSYVNHHDEIIAKGVDEIVCIAVNDPFVLDAWGKTQNVQGKVRLLSDGNATFTKAIGLSFDGSMAALGTRSRRYAMIVEDGTVEFLAVEDAPPMMEVTGADKILEAL
ncbi:MAG: peroxiredoxin [Geminicoccaceae bacterium]|nr:peroxiredoxin [Geminicoccaceae bacterium]MCB9945584.1 peroxiredoxin [Geminicoccaceae bacterium]